MYDLHCHILPELDDGSTSIEETLEMIRIAVCSGVNKIVCTPHRKDVSENTSVYKVLQLVDDLNRYLIKEGIDCELFSGMENHLDDQLTGDILKGKALSINQTRYALVEMPFFGGEDSIINQLDDLLSQNITPVLAHPERIEAVQSNPDLLYEFVEKGILNQITSGSLLGLFGEKVQNFTETMLSMNLAHILASDCHSSSGDRSPNLDLGVAKCIELVGDVKTMAMVIDTPKLVLNNKLEDIPSPSSGKR